MEIWTSWNRRRKNSPDRRKKLKETIHLDINFEAEDALAKLEKLGAIKNENETWFPLPMEETAKDIKNREGIN